MIEKNRTCRFFIAIAIGILQLSPAAFGQNRGFQEKGASQNNISNDLYEKKYALIIGINKYSDSKLTDLRYAVNDATIIKDILIEDYHYEDQNVKILLDERATEDNILEALGDYLLEDIAENSQLLVYFAGHGTTISGNNTEEVGYLLPTDANVSNPSLVYSTGIAMNELHNLSRNIRPKHVLFLMDACYGGLAQTRGSMSSVFVRSALGRKARQLITAGSADQEVIESAEWGHSAFTKAMIKALREGLADSNLDGIISATELFVFIQNRVPYLAQSQGGEQTPQFSRLTPDTGTFLFIKDQERLLADLRSGDDMIIEVDEEEISRSFETPIQISANVDNARVYIDDKEVGWLSHGMLRHSISPGFYRVEITKEKYRAEPQEIEIKPDTSLVVDFDMRPLFTVVDFSVEPSDAAVYVDGEFVGSGVFREELARGGHRISISKDGYKPYNENVNFVQDTLSLYQKLEKIETRVELYSTPLGARVKLHGDSLGMTPLTLSIGYGIHRFILSAEGYRDYLFEVDVTESGIVREVIKMKETPQVIARRTYRDQIRSHGISALEPIRKGVQAPSLLRAYPKRGAGPEPT